MTDTAGTVTNDVSNEMASFEVADFRRAMAETELEDIIDELVEAFLEDAPIRMGAIQSAVEASAPEEVRSSAHAYKSAAASMGATQLAELLRQLEVSGAEGDSSRSASLLIAARAAHDTVVARLIGEFR